MSIEKFTPGECPVCGITFERKKETQKYCSQKCTRKMNGKQQQRREHWWVNSKGYTEGWCFVNGQWKRKKLHRRVVELHIGRELTLQEDVHHINGDKLDNRIENLMLIQHGKHSIITNNNRQYKSGYKMNISEQERKRRSDWMKSVHLKKARGEE